MFRADERHYEVISDAEKVNIVEGKRDDAIARQPPEERRERHVDDRVAPSLAAAAVGKEPD